jgi:hypothetical protein
MLPDRRFSITSWRKPNRGSASTARDGYALSRSNAVGAARRAVGAGQQLAD